MPKFRPYTAKDLPKVVQFIGQCFLDRHFSDYHIGDIIHAMSSRYRGEDLERYFWLFEPQGELIAFAELSKAEWATFTLITHPSCEADMELIPSPKRYFINSYRVDYAPNSLEPQERSGYEMKFSNQR